MIGVGIAAHLTEFMLTKLIGQKIYIAVNLRGKAARAFLDLFESLSCRERSLNALEKKAQYVVGGSANRLFGVSFGRITKEIQSGTNSFIQSL